MLRPVTFGLMGLLNATAIAQGAECTKGLKIQGTVQAGGLARSFQLVGSDQKYGLAGLYLNQKFHLQGEIRLFVKSPKVDRYGRLLVQAFQNKGWIQGQMLEKGAALVYGLGLDRGCLAEMQLFEKIGERHKRGLWENEKLPLRAENIENLAKKVGHFVLIQGKVLSVGDRSRRLYLNFGQKWSQDFTISIAKKGKGAFKGDLLRLMNVEQKTVRIRGVLEERQGPLIRLFDESQITIID